MGSVRGACSAAVHVNERVRGRTQEPLSPSLARLKSPRIVGSSRKRKSESGYRILSRSELETDAIQKSPCVQTCACSCATGDRVSYSAERLCAGWMASVLISSERDNMRYPDSDFLFRDDPTIRWGLESQGTHSRAPECAPPSYLCTPLARMVHTISESIIVMIK